MLKLLTGIMSGCTPTCRKQVLYLRNRKGTVGNADRPNTITVDAVMRNCKRSKTNLSVSWTDYTKAFDMVFYSWPIENLGIFETVNNFVTLLSHMMQHAKTILIALSTTLHK